MKEGKFTVIYSFSVHPAKEIDFIHAWSEMTRLIYEYEGSYGSRLHKVDSYLFIGYAQWPDKATWENSGNNLPDSATKLRDELRECCQAIKTEFESILIVDLLHKDTFT